MKISLTLITLVLFAATAFAQQSGKITGTVRQSEKPAAGATIHLLKSKDSSTIKLSVAGKDGVYAFDLVPEGSYIVAVTAAGQLKTYSIPFTLTRDQVMVVPLIELANAANDMAGIVVTAKRPLVEQKIDRTIVNVDASITNIGTSALEVLEKSPGVLVDRDGNISLKGKDGVMIMVDGRPTQLSGADLTNLLRGMSSSQLDQIEIMTNPPARYDASGTAGIINIKTKKMITAGMNGSASLSYGQGKYPKTNESFNFNYRKGKINFYTSLGHNYQKRYLDLLLDRNILSTNNNSVEKIFNQDATRIGVGHAYNAKLGLDFFATGKTTLGAVVNLNSRSIQSDNPSVTYISNASKELESITRAMVATGSNASNISANLNFRNVLDKKGREITSDVDYVKFTADNDLFMVNSYTDAFGNPHRNADSLTGDLPQDINVYSARVDYLHPIKKDMRLEAGIKSSLVNTDNNARYDSILNGNLIPDLNRSNHFVYRENINAAYVNLSAPLSKKITAQLGLRLENTNARGRQKSTGQNFDRQYTQLFPTAFFQYKADENNIIGANFGRRVRRPSYQSLNPFIRFIDRYTYSLGNPNLRPSMSNNIELSHTWKNRITTTVNYTVVNDIIQEVIQQKGNEAYNTPENVSSMKQAGLAVNASLPVTKWWTSNTNLNISYDQYTGIINNDAVNLEATGYAINTMHQFKISGTLAAELNGSYRSGRLEGIMRIEPIFIMGAGISQKILKNKGTIRFTARDMFHTQKMKGSSRYSNVDFEIRQVAETQVFTLGFTYNFSKGKKIAPVKRTAGSSDEEQGRIGGN